MFKTTISSFSARTVTCAPSTLGRRGFHASPASYKTVKETVTDVADKMNKTVGKGLASAIDQGEKATNAAKETISSKTQDAEHEMDKAKGAAKKAGKDVAADAKKAKADVEKEL